MAKRRINLLPLGRNLALQRNLLVVAVMRIMSTVVYGFLIMTIMGLGLLGFMWWQGWSGSVVESDKLRGQMQKYREVRRMIDNENKLLLAVNSLGEQRIIWSDVLMNLMTNLPVGITLYNIQSITDGGGQILEIRGTAVTRTMLVIFEDKLRSLEWVEDVEAPRSNLLERNNAEFSFRVVVKKVIIK